MKKTIFTILLCGVMILGLTGCNNSEKKMIMIFTLLMEL